jgi:hypothetical protein
MNLLIVKRSAVTVEEGATFLNCRSGENSKTSNQDHADVSVRQERRLIRR